MNKICLHAKNVRHVYGKGEGAVVALQNIDVSIMTGEVTLLMGPSGSGKTTLIQILGGLLRPMEGDVLLGKKNIARLHESVRGALRLRYFGFIFQASNLFPMLTAVENVMLAMDIAGRRGPDVRKAAMAYLKAVKLADRAAHYPHQLSGGQRQRVSLARALAGRPPIILADEPTAALDAENGQTVIQLLHDLAHKHGRAVVIVTHDSRLIEKSDRVIQIADGQLISDTRRSDQ